MIAVLKTGNSGLRDTQTNFDPPVMTGRIQFLV